MVDHLLMKCIHGCDLITGEWLPVPTLELLIPTTVNFSSPLTAVIGLIKSIPYLGRWVILRSWFDYVVMCWLRGWAVYWCLCLHKQLWSTMDRLHLSRILVVKDGLQATSLSCVFSFQITGDTVYNLMKIGELETDKEDRPVDPPQIVSVEVIWLHAFVVNIIMSFGCTCWRTQI